MSFRLKPQAKWRNLLHSNDYRFLGRLGMTVKELGMTVIVMSNAVRHLLHSNDGRCHSD